MHFGETNPTSAPTRIGGRPLRGAPTASIASKWRNKANPGRNPEDHFCGVTAGAASTDSLLAKQSHRVPSPPCRAPPPTPVWAKFTKRTNLRNLNEIKDTGSIGASDEYSRTPVGGTKPPVRNGARASRPLCCPNNGRDARAPVVRHFGGAKPPRRPAARLLLALRAPVDADRRGGASRCPLFGGHTAVAAAGRTSWQRLRFSGSA
jgi:hypothetical protein